MADVMNATQMRVGHLIEYENGIYRIFDVMHITPGNLRAKVQVKMKNIETGISTEHRFRSDERVNRVSLDSRQMEFLYKDGESLAFMDTESYEQVSLPKEFLGEAARFLTANLKVAVHYYQEKAVGVELPVAVELKVVSTGAIVKGATATNQYKPATVESGYEIQVPPFIKEGDIVRVDTASGKYLERASTS